MGKRFEDSLSMFFGCSAGAYSKVTRDEFNKSQITFVGPEQELVEKHFGKTLAAHHGSIENIKAAGTDPELTFKIFPTGEKKKLTVSYKTNKPRELRFYARKDTFKPKSGEYWCVFVKNEEIWLGAFSSWMRDSILEGVISNHSRSSILELETDDFQDIINTHSPEKIVSTKKSWKRDPKISMNALVKSGWKCEIHPEFPTFVSRATRRNFVEAHHLVPMKLQERFHAENLDSVDNICSLNPLSHRMLHHAKFENIEADLVKLIKNRPILLERLKLHSFDILEMYL